MYVQNNYDYLMYVLEVEGFVLCVKVTMYFKESGPLFYIVYTLGWADSWNSIQFWGKFVLEGTRKH